MKQIQIDFIDFWDGFSKTDNFIFNTLIKKYDVVINSENPNYIFFSTFGYEHLYLNNKDIILIFFSGENITPDFNLTDYAIGSDHINFKNRYLRLPLYTLYPSFSDLINENVIDPEVVLNRNFCSFVYSNAAYAHPARIEFFNELSKYKKIDAGGALFNNVGARVADKILFIKNYKFNIAFENSMVDGYTTEKIMEPMSVNSLPIYWGNKAISEDFNTDSFINASDFSSWKQLVEYIEYLDTNDDEYLSLLSKPRLVNPTYHNWSQLLLSFLSYIIDQDLKLAKVLQPYGYTHNYSSRFKKKNDLQSSAIINLISRLKNKIF